MTLKSTYFHDSKLFHDLKAMGRDNFSYEGARALQAYLNEADFEIEYDPIAFCCEWAEYETIGMLADDYSDAPQADQFDDPDDWEKALMDWVNDETIVIEFNNGIIIQQF